jgi:hypothetical protein
MCPERTDPLPLRQILNQHARPVGALLARARRIAEINRALRDWHDGPWIHHVRIANIRGETVVVYVASAPALVPLQRLGPSLLAWLQSRYQIACTRIETKVRPTPPDTAARVYRRAPVKRNPSG